MNPIIKEMAVWVFTIILTGALIRSIAIIAGAVSVLAGWIEDVFLQRADSTQRRGRNQG